MAQKVALALSSGGARGMAHIGVIEELEKNDFEITSIAGSSFGAVIGGIYASGNLQIFKNWLLSLSRLDVVRLMDFTISASGFVKGEKVFREIQNFIPDMKIEELKIPFAAIAVDVLHHKEVVLTEGSLFDAIHASASMPSLLQPFNMDGIDLIDGGILNPLPVNRVKRVAGDILVAVDLNTYDPYYIMKQKSEQRQKKIERNNHLFYERWDKFFPKYKEKDLKFGYFELVNESFDLMQEQLSMYMTDIYQPEMLVSVPRNEASTFEFHRADEMVDFGRKEFRKSLRKFEIKRAHSS